MVLYGNLMGLYSVGAFYTQITEYCFYDYLMPVLKPCPPTLLLSAITQTEGCFPNQPFTGVNQIWRYTVLFRYQCVNAPERGMGNIAWVLIWFVEMRHRHIFATPGRFAIYRRRIISVNTKLCVDGLDTNGQGKTANIFFGFDVMLIKRFCVKKQLFDS